MYETECNVNLLKPNFKPENSVSTKKEMRPLRDGSHARAEFARAEPQKKGSLVDIFFMKSPLHGHAKKGNVGEIARLCTVRREALSAADYEAYVNGERDEKEEKQERKERRRNERAGEEKRKKNVWLKV